MSNQKENSGSTQKNSGVSDIQSLMDIQSKFQTLVGNHNLHGNIDFIRDQTLALIAEVTEAMNETPWKSWKRQQAFNEEKFVEELVDCQLILLNLVLSSGISASHFVEACKQKQEINVARQKDGY